MNKKRFFTSAALFIGFSTTAIAFPWDIDLVDSIFIRGYEKPMATPPQGAVSINNYRPTGFENLDQAVVDNDETTTAYVLSILQAKDNFTLSDPFEGQENDPSTLAMGKKGFKTYCQTCHGVKGSGKTAELDTWPLHEAGRFQGIPNVHMLDSTGKITSSGAGAIKSVAELYLIIRNGRGRMPSYGHAMSEKEIWSSIHYVRSLPGTKITD
jgi:mono/diheme cytochrome c family protein